MTTVEVTLPEFMPGSGSCPSGKVWYSAKWPGREQIVGVRYPAGYIAYSPAEARALAAELLAAVHVIESGIGGV